MKKLAIIVGVASLIVFTNCKNKKAEDQEIEVEETKSTAIEEAPKNISFILESKSESNASGKVAFSETDGVVTLEIKLTGLTPGIHAVHIHEKADCSSPDGKSTGGHWNPTLEKHGKWGDPEGYHKGDIGNLEVGENGTGMISMQTDKWCIGCGDEKKDILGKAIIVHQGVDDFTTQPTGDAGGRVSCGGIIQ